MAVIPRCPVFGHCGGCSLQDKEYSIQLADKKNGIREALSMRAIALPDELTVYFKNEYGYRNRMDFALGEDGFGLRQKGKFDRIVSFTSCPISNEGVNECLAEVNAWFIRNRQEISVFDNRKRKGCIRYATVRSSLYTKDRSVTFILNSDSDQIEKHRKLIGDFCAGTKIPNVAVGLVQRISDHSAVPGCEVLKGSDAMTEMLAGLNFRYNTQGFFQSNPAGTIDMLIHVKNLIKEQYDYLLDLYGGVGTFGIFCAGKAPKVLIADSAEESIKCAAENIKLNNISNAEALVIDAMKPDALNSLAEKLTGKGIFIIDPPRSGLHKKTVKFILKHAPDTIIYVSCNTRQFAEDLSKLSQLYTMSDFAVFDMFPQTPHVETIAVLNKS